MSPISIPISIGEQAAALARDWHTYVTTSAAARRKAALLMRTSRAMTHPRSALVPAILEVLATRPNQWWQAGDLVEPLAERGWDQSATQIGHALRRAHRRDQVRRREREQGRTVVYRIGGAA